MKLLALGLKDDVTVRCYDGCRTFMPVVRSALGFGRLGGEIYQALFDFRGSFYSNHLRAHFRRAAEPAAIPS
jgi:hypothetical protein